MEDATINSSTIHTNLPIFGHPEFFGSNLLVQEIVDRGMAKNNGLSRLIACFMEGLANPDFLVICRANQVRLSQGQHAQKYSVLFHRQKEANG